MLVVAENLRARLTEALEGLWNGMAIGVVDTHLYDRYFRLEVVQKSWVEEIFDP